MVKRVNEGCGGGEPRLSWWLKGLTQQLAAAYQLHNAAWLLGFKCSRRLLVGREGTQLVAAARPPAAGGFHGCRWTVRERGVREREKERREERRRDSWWRSKGFMPFLSWLLLLLILLLLLLLLLLFIIFFFQVHLLERPN